MEYDLERAKNAVAYLVNTSYFKHHLKKLFSAIEKPRSLPFREEAEVLNELVIIGRQDKKALKNLIELAEFKRDSRNDYQRNYMAQRRVRERKVIELEQFLTGKTLNLEERRALLMKQSEIWAKEKVRHLARSKNTDWKGRNAATEEFWALKDKELDALLAEAQAQASKVVRRKRVVTVAKPEPRTVMGQALKNALTKRKK